MRSRTLRLSTERLSALDTADLRGVAGGRISLPALVCMPYTLQNVECVNDFTFEACPEPGTLPLEHCV